MPGQVTHCMYYKFGDGVVCHGSEPPIPRGPANRSVIPTSSIPVVDDCAALNPARGRTIRQTLADDTMKDFIWGRTEDVTRCLNNLTITNFDALFTLHNLKYGLAETYAFTDIANGLDDSVEVDTCNLKLHSLDVDIDSFIDDRISEYAAAREHPSGPFSLCSTADFYFVLPIRFESYMRDGAQVVNLGFPNLNEIYYPGVYGKPVTALIDIVHGDEHFIRG
ncbi:hypothetical protein Pmar_PMAR012889 [Perkinsus marinus ATCC 50983]|uniref:Uncharacterized protein n=1 Tax=Perkinsus marinus (strain ATCC 50983 / TXsc) TaxID=423536 RepID=C5LWG2_PERM5|nr:hypothetical protein Pmar_PMAR012889 [Perkinsus marinus ATCC 50983]EEQ98875.1 hypothetical protein Pmar_PMAR012889 [Perkinsus marinus ATCC 50983]|eukprot:XP_002766158.1 hypothetical protein Pmar_PMAR012889 [Perkinsus marinus ATCC 50983]